MQALRDRGLPQVLCEGGPHLFGSLLAADLVDELCLSLEPELDAGDARAHRARRARGRRGDAPRARAPAPGDMLLLRYARA